MRRLLVSMLLLLVPFGVPAERGFFDVEVLELTEKGNNEYVLKYIQLSEPFGYTHEKDREVIVHLRFQCPAVQCTGEDDGPTEAKYLAAIEFLKQQIAASRKIRFGIVDRGYVKIEGTANEYQSNGLEIYDGIVCSDYDFFGDY